MTNTYFERKQSTLQEMIKSRMCECNDIASYIYKGISETFWKGRMEIINEDPFFMIDGAHNSHGVLALASSLKELYPNEKFHFINTPIQQLT